MIRIGPDLFFGAESQPVRQTLVLPCGGCSSPGPHTFRIERAHGFSVLCERCKAKRGEDAGDDIGEALHARSVTADDRPALLTRAICFQGREQEPKS